MSTFKDALDRKWDVVVTFATVKQLRSTLDLDILDTQNVLGRLVDDVELLVNALCLICENQFEKHGINEDQFGEGLAGDHIDAATNALLDAIVDFTPSRKRTLLRQIKEKTDEVMDRTVELGLEEIKATDANQIAEKIATNLSTSTPNAGALPVASE